MRRTVTDRAQARQRVMSVTARATAVELATALDRLQAPHGEDVRPVEIGLVMLRGRTGGDGAPFNLGEATVTRSAVRLPTGEIGLSYILGRDPVRARAAATLDALVQALGEEAVMEPLHAVGERLRAEEATVAAQGAATRVDFFTMVRGED